MKRFVISILLLINLASSYAGIIQGVVKDSKTGEVLVGATLFLKNSQGQGTATGLDGTFMIKNIKGNSAILVCSYLSYNTVEKTIQIPASEISKISIELNSSEMKLEGIEVMASNKTTDIGVRTIERLSSNVVNIVGARSIEISPDLTVANVLGRISGVTMERNSTGEGQYAILRGMDKRYNITLVNGVKISSPNNKQRFVPLDIFPSELLDRLEVSKTQTSEMEGDATGGAINLVMKDAPYRFTLSFNASIGYNSLFFKRDFISYDKNKVIGIAPYEQHGNAYNATMSDFGNGVNTIMNKKPLPNGMLGFLIGNRVFNKRLGFIVAANYQNMNKGANSAFFEDEMVQTESTVRLTSMKEREYSESQVQYGVHTKLDFVLSSKNKLEFYNAYIGSENSQVRQSTSTSFKLSYEPESGTLDMSNQTRIRATNQQIFVSTLQGDHKIGDKLNLNWSAVYSNAGFQRPDQTIVNLDNLKQNYIDNINIDADGSERRWEHNSDQDYSAITHLKYNLPISAGKKLTLQVGGLYRQKKRDNFFVKYTLKPVDSNQTFSSIDEIIWSVYTPRGSVGPLNYNATEIIGAGYLQSRFEINKFEIIAGLRTEYTNQGYHMYFPNAGESPDGNQIYTDFLPNIHFKFKPQDKTNLRASYFRSVNRPGFFEIVPYQIVYEDYQEYGNKDLKRAIIDNFDLRWEYFPKPTDQIMIGTFYKNIKSPIEYAYYSVNQRQSGYGPRNLGDAENFGIEIDIIKYIRLFGIKANYTYTHSAITTPKVYYAKDDLGNTHTYTEDQPRPLVGQAAHVANISLLFKDVNNGWDAQLAASYTGDKIIIASRFLNSDYWQKGSVQLDASIEKKFKNGLSFFLKTNNLLNTPLIEFIKTNNEYNNKFSLQSPENGETLIRKDYYMQYFLIGLRYKL